MNKKILLLLVIVLVIGVVLFVKIPAKSQDHWECRSGEWIRIGSPKVSQPKTICPGKSSSGKLPLLPPDSTVVSFYNWLSKAQGPLKSGSYKESQYLTDGYKKKISLVSVASSNPFTCSEEEAVSYRIIKSSVNNNTTAIVELEQIQKTEKILLSVELKVVGQDWKIDDVKCPK